MLNNNFISRRSALRRGVSACFLTAVALLLPFLGGCGGGGGGGSKNGSSNTVTGIVKDSSRADIAVGGATVTIGGKTTVTTTVDQANENNPTGSFTLKDVPVGSETATVAAPGYDTQTIAFSPRVTSGINTPIELIINIGQISGRIIGTDGKPAAGAFVTVVATGDNDSVVTAQDGTFLLINIPPGATQVSAVLGTSAVTKDVVVVNGNTSVGDLTLVDDPNPNPPGYPATLVGSVTLGNGLGAGANTVVTLFRDDKQLEQVTTDNSGNFGFYVPVGVYKIVVTRTGFDTYTSAPITISNPSVALQADVTLNPQ